MQRKSSEPTIFVGSNIAFLFKTTCIHLKDLTNDKNDLVKNKNDFFKKNEAFYNDYLALPKTIECETNVSALEDKRYQQQMLEILSKHDSDLKSIEKIKKTWLEHRVLAQNTQEEYAKRYAECKEVVEGYEKPYTESLDKLNSLLSQEQKSLQYYEKLAIKALFTAIKNNEIEKIDKLLNAGLHVDSKNIFGLTPLFYAIKKDNVQLVQRFLERKANPNIEIELKKGPSLTPLIATVIWTFNNTHILELLLRYGAGINHSNQQLNTALHIAISMLAIDHACYLLRQGASIELINFRGETSLNILDKRKHIFWHKEIKEVVKELKQRKSLSKH